MNANLLYRIYEISKNDTHDLNIAIAKAHTESEFSHEVDKEIREFIGAYSKELSEAFEAGKVVFGYAVASMYNEWKGER